MDTIRLSKFLSLVLRHQPQAIGLTLDAQGWAEVDDLIAQAGQHGTVFTVDDLAHVVATSDKSRFTLSDDGRRIRAAQGHSVDVDLNLAPRTPPATLFHGTATRFADAIGREGLTRQSRRHVHLSADVETALRVGQRHGKPIVFRIDTSAMHAAGHIFYMAENGVWLTASVPPGFLLAI